MKKYILSSFIIILTCAISGAIILTAQGSTKPNFIIDGDMEANTITAWPRYQRPQTIRKTTNGSQVLEIISQTNAGVQQKIKQLIPGRTYTLSGNYILNAGEFRLTLRCNNTCSTNGNHIYKQFIDTEPITNTTQTLSLNFVAASTTVDLLMSVKGTTAGPGMLQLDNLEIIDITPAVITPPPIPPSPTQTTLTDQEYAALSIANIHTNTFPSETAPTRTGNTYYVATTGSNDNPGTMHAPLKTLAQAERMIESGDTIIVRGGTYNDCDSYTDCYELTLTTPDVTWQAYPGETPIINASGRSRRGVNLLGNNIIFDGFIIQGFTGTGIKLSDATTQDTAPYGQHIKNTTIIMAGDASDGIGIYGFHNGIRLDNVTIQNATLQGITCAETCNNIRINNTHIAMGTANNESSGADGIGIEDGDNILITNTEVKNTGADGIDIKGSRVAIINSYIHHTGQAGIKLWQGGDIINSLIQETGTKTYYIAVDIATGNARFLNSAVINHNTNSRATSYFISYGYNDQANGTFSFINSLACGGTGGIYISPNATQEHINSIEQPTTSCEHVGITITPAGYTFSDTSLLTNTGSNAYTVPPKDLSKNNRIIGAAIDIGPFEKQ